MSTYAKFLKGVLSKKRTLGNQELVALAEDCSVILMNKMAIKLGDPGSFSIPCIMGNVQISRALCDLGASVNVLPLNIAKKIGMNELLPTNMTLLLADRYIKRHMGVLEDVPVKVGEYYIPSGFDVLDTPEDRHTPNILGRPFLDTGEVLIDVRNGRLYFRIEGDVVEFNLPNLVNKPMLDQACTFEIIDEVVEEVTKEEAEFEEAFQISIRDEEMDENLDIDDDDEVINKLEGLVPPKVQLKYFSPSLKYAFLGEGEPYPVIINASLNEVQENKLFKVLKIHR
ncbi:uncharacterized protein LOC141618275 [Silene latifolia]|uniref:uncharacterized protein LOC141618275 n=1 Tax=Silene latifolia TaxID=37657 RepID=UPI003D770CAE